MSTENEKETLEQLGITSITEAVPPSDSVHSTDQNASPIPVIPQLAVALTLLVAVFGVTYIGAEATLTKNSKPQVDEHHISEVVAPPKDQQPASLGAYDDTKIRAKSAIVWDVANQKILFNKNADAQLPIASITKLMTALVSYELLEPSARITIPGSAVSVEGDSGIVEGELFSVQDLVDYTLITSSNDGAAALGSRAGGVITESGTDERAFVRAMNIRADELGLTQTRFNNSTGLDVSSTEAGAYSSARDVALLTEYMIANAYDIVALTNLDTATVQNSEGSRHLAQNTNEVTDDIDGLIASKTGYTQLAGGNLVVAFNAGLNRPIIVVVLGSTISGRFEDTLELIRRTRLHIESEA